MKCEEFKTLIVDYIYDEISEKDREKLEKHLEHCSSCLAEFNEFKKTSGVLQQWEDEESDVNLTFETNKKRWFSDLWEKVQIGSTVRGMGLAFASVLILLSLANTKIQYKEGDFTFEMGFRKSQQAEIPSEMIMTKADLDQLKMENLAMISNLMQDYSKQNKVETVSLVNEYYKEIENKRKTDLQLVSGAIEKIHYGAEERINQTDRTLNDLIRYVNMQNQ